MLQNYQDKEMYTNKEVMKVCPICGGIMVSNIYFTKKFEKNGQLSFFKVCECNQKRKEV